MPFPLHSGLGPSCTLTLAKVSYSCLYGPCASEGAAAPKTTTSQCLPLPHVLSAEQALPWILHRTAEVNLPLIPSFLEFENNDRKDPHESRLFPLQQLSELQA